MTDPDKDKAQEEAETLEGAEEQPRRSFPLLDNFFQRNGEGWTEGDSKWFEVMTGEKDTFPTVPDPPDAFL